MTERTRTAADAPTLPERGVRVVAIGASAGWFEALSELLRAVPAGTGLGFVIVVHLDPRHESHMAQVLQRITEMPVREAGEGMLVEPDHVYVIPSNAYLTLRQGALHLTPREPDKAEAHAIDRFFRSVADDAGPAAVGVVLSGTLSDGTQGLKDIRAAGGFTYAQTPESAKHREMPWNAISSGSVDLVMPPAEIARDVAQLPAREASGALQKVSDRDIEKLLQVLRHRTGVDFARYRRSTVWRRIQRRMMACKKEDLKDYTEMVRKDSEEAHRLYDEMLIHVTRFFREPEVFEFLRARILPGLVKGRGRDEPLRVWVAGCATGEEAYSFAILLQEYMESEGLDVPVSVFATDISDKAIRTAREGLYPETIADDMTQERLLRYFERVEGGYRVSKAVRGNCIFAVHNLVTDAPFSKIDIASCRNVLVYMETELQRRVLLTLHYALKADGRLLLGTSESSSLAGGLFQAVDKECKVYRKGDAVPRLPQAWLAQRPPTWEAPPPAAAQEPSSWSEQELSQEADRLLLEHACPAAVVINGNLDVVQFRGDTGPYLKPASGRASLNLLKMLPSPLGVEVHQRLEEAKAQGPMARKEPLRAKGGRQATVEVLPLQGPSREPFFLVVFRDARGNGAAEGAPGGWWARRLARAPAPPPREAAPRLAAAERELRDIQATMQRLVEEREATLEELRSSNEEAMSTNEELQSTNEELETAKEELQSTNEELNTLNDELQERNADVQRVNNDLLNILNSVALPIIILGPDLRIRRFTPKSQQLLNLLPTDIGRPFTDLQHPFSVDLKAEVMEVLESFAPRELEVRDQRGNWFELTIRPYRTSDSRVDGVVLAFLPPILSKRRPAGVEEAFEAAEALAETTWDPVVVLDRNFRVLAGNAPFFEVLGVAQERAQGQPLLELKSGLSDSKDLRALLATLEKGHEAVSRHRVTFAIANGGERRLVVNARSFGRFGEEALIVLAFRELQEGKGP